MKAITLYDVVLPLRGVLSKTVSRVINDAEHVSARTHGEKGAGHGELHYVLTVARSGAGGQAHPYAGTDHTDLALHAPSQIVSASQIPGGRKEASVLDLNGGTSATVPGRASGSCWHSAWKPAGERAA